MAFDIHAATAPFRKHPAIAIGAVGAGALVLFLYWHSGSSGTAAVSGSTGTDPAALAYQAQVNQLQAGLAGQSSAQSFQLQRDTLAANTQNYSTDASLKVALATLTQQGESTAASIAASLKENSDATAAQVAISANTNATQINLASLTVGEQLGIAKINADTQVSLGNLSATISQSQIAATTQIAGLGAYVQTLISNNATNLGIVQSNNAASVNIAQTNAGVSIAKINASASTTNSALGLVAGFAAALL